MGFGRHRAAGDPGHVPAHPQRRDGDGSRSDRPPRPATRTSHVTCSTTTLKPNHKQEPTMRQTLVTYTYRWRWMMTTLNASFEVTPWGETTYRERDGRRLTTASASQRFAGDVAGEGSVEW